MIKLLWNTQSQKIPNAEISKINEKKKIDFFWGNYHKKSSDIWIYEILKSIEYTKIESQSELNKEDILIIIDSICIDDTDFLKKKQKELFIQN